MKDGTDGAPAAVLFDVDGTLIDSYRLYLESYRRALEPVLGHRPSDAELIALRPSSERAFLVEVAGPEAADACHEDFCRHYEALHATFGDGPYEGVREMLAALRSAGIPLGVVTGKGRRAWEVTTRAIDLGDFRVVVTEDEMESPKPHPGGLLAGAAGLGVEPGAAVYVGDTLADLEAGRRAGMAVAAALWAKTDPRDLERFLQQIRRYEPDWVFERPADASRAFAPWC